MRTRMKIENPGNVEVTLTVTMKASEWEALRASVAMFCMSTVTDTKLGNSERFSHETDI